jgi:hypothetical protein
MLEEPEYAIWTKIYGPDITKTLFKHILNYRLPSTYIVSSKINVICNMKCDFNHFMHQSDGYCCEEPNCPTQYRKVSELQKARLNGPKAIHNCFKNFGTYCVPKQLRESVKSDIVYLHYSFIKI